MLSAKIGVQHRRDFDVLGLRLDRVANPEIHLDPDAGAAEVSKESGSFARVLLLGTDRLHAHPREVEAEPVLRARDGADLLEQRSHSGVVRRPERQ